MNDFDEFEELDNMRNGSSFTPTLVISLLFGIFSFFFSIGCCYFALFSFAFQRGLKYNSKRSFYTNSSDYYGIALPFKFIIESKYLFPVNYSINTTSEAWIYGLSYIIETSLIDNLEENNMFQINTYYNFSSDNYADFLSSHFGITRESLSESIGKLYRGFTYYGDPMMFIELCREFGVYFISKLYEALLSEVCYVSSYTVYRGVGQIKYALFKYEKPLILSYYFPKVKIPFSKNHTSVSEFDISSDSDYITVELPDEKTQCFPSLDYNSSELPVTSSIVGYNDNFNFRYNGKKYKGGLIIRGRNPYVGHSYQYYMEEISPRQEELICGKVNKRLYRCVNSFFCNISLVYERVDDKIYSRTELVDQTTSENQIDLSLVPDEYLDSIMQSVETSGYCGYSFLPYDLFYNMEKRSSSSFGVNAYLINMTWSKQSLEIISRSSMVGFSDLILSFDIGSTPLAYDL